MKFDNLKLNLVTSVSVVLVVVTTALFMIERSSDAKDKGVWEYKVDTYSVLETEKSAEQLTQAGKEGWELVLAHPLPVTADGNHYVYVFKRKK